MRVCGFKGCERKYHAKGYCKAHRRQKRTGKELKPIRFLNGNQGCKFPGCDKKHESRGYCRGHSWQDRNWEGPMPIRKFYKYPEDWGLTYENINDVLEYDSDNGDFYWKVDISPKSPIGSLAGYNHVHGYRILYINGKSYLTHRIVYMVSASEKKCKLEGALYKELPRKGDTIHHKNGDRSDNRIENLEYRHGNHGPGAKGKDLKKENKKLRKKVKKLKKEITNLKWDLKYREQQK